MGISSKISHDSKGPKVILSPVAEVAACGDCNIMKYKWDLEDFLEHCRKVARFHQGTLDWADSDAEVEVETAWQSANLEDGLTFLRGPWRCRAMRTADFGVF